MREQIECEGVTFEAWPEHGCWYEKGSRHDSRSGRSIAMPCLMASKPNI